jgi:hypothetical protein
VRRADRQVVCGRILAARRDRDPMAFTQASTTSEAFIIENPLADGERTGLRAPKP